MGGVVVAGVAHAHAAAGISLGAQGARPCDMAPLGRPRPSSSTHLVYVLAAEPWGDSHLRGLPIPGPVGSGLAPSPMPSTAGHLTVGTPHPGGTPIRASAHRLGQQPAPCRPLDAVADQING